MTALPFLRKRRTSASSLSPTSSPGSRPCQHPRCQMGLSASSPPIWTRWRCSSPRHRYLVGPHELPFVPVNHTAAKGRNMNYNQASALSTSNMILRKTGRMRAGSRKQALPNIRNHNVLRPHLIHQPIHSRRSVHDVVALYQSSISHVLDSIYWRIVARVLVTVQVKLHNNSMCFVISIHRRLSYGNVFPTAGLCVCCKPRPYR